MTAARRRFREVLPPESECQAGVYVPGEAGRRPRTTAWTRRPTSPRIRRRRIRFVYVRRTEPTAAYGRSRGVLAEGRCQKKMKRLTRHTKGGMTSSRSAAPRTCCPLVATGGSATRRRSSSSHKYYLKEFIYYTLCSIITRLVVIHFDALLYNILNCPLCQFLNKLQCGAAAKFPFIIAVWVVVE